MRKVVYIAVILLSGCSLTPAERWQVAAGVLVVGAIAAYEADHGFESPTNNPQPEKLYSKPWGGK